MELTALILSIFSLFVSACVAMWSWWKSRAIYGIEEIDYYTKQNRQEDNKDLVEKLASGHYTILHVGAKGVAAGIGGDYIEVVLAKIKK